MNTPNHRRFYLHAVKHRFRLLLALVCLFAAANVVAVAQTGTGTVKGKVRVEGKETAEGIKVTARRGDEDVAQTTTDRKGEFSIAGLAPGIYSFVFRKPGLRVGTVDDVEVKSGKTRNLTDRLVLPVDEGTLAFIRGSVFSPQGRSVRGAQVELMRTEANGKERKIDGRVTNETGSFAFRLPPDVRSYRVVVKIDGAEPTSKTVEVDGAMIYRVSITLQPRGTTAAQQQTTPQQ